MSDWPHSPAHHFPAAGAYIVTAATYQKAHHFRTPDRLDLLQKELFAAAQEYGWQLQAWALFSNHYHTKLTFQRSYFARLNYVHQNPVRHRLARVATAYPWCSAGWFEQRAELTFCRAIQRFKIDAVNVYDDFEPCVAED